MLYDGKIVFEGTPEEVKASHDEIVRQFVEGRAEGPIPVYQEWADDS
jgi:phospholipid/cholesterol/gamma-HCH transport system ATP-binding protein